MKTKSSKILAVLLSMVLLLQALPLPSYAEEAEEKVFSSLEDRQESGKEESTLLVVPGKREANPTEASPGVMETERSASSKENGNVREEKEASSKDLRQKPGKKKPASSEAEDTKMEDPGTRDQQAPASYAFQLLSREDSQPIPGAEFILLHRKEGASPLLIYFMFIKLMNKMFKI